MWTIPLCHLRSLAILMRFIISSLSKTAEWREQKFQQMQRAWSTKDWKALQALKKETGITGVPSLIRETSLDSLLDFLMVI